MLLAIIFSVVSLIVSFVILYFTGLLQSNPYNWFWLIPLAVLVSSVIISITWAGILLFGCRNKNKLNTGRVNNSYVGIMRLFARFLLLLSFTRIRKKNFYRIPKENAVYIFNHTSFVDAWYVLDSVTSKFALVSVDVMSKVPLLGNASKEMGTIFIDKNDPSTFQGMSEIAEDYLLNQDTSVVISPEGVVKTDGVLNEFKNGAFKIAMKCKKPIVLLKFTGTSRLAKNKSMFKPKTIDSEVLKVVTYEEYKNMSLKQLATYCREFYQD